MRLTSRPGASLVELLVALTLFATVGSVALGTLGTAARWYERITLVAEQRAQVDAARRLLQDLPVALSSADSDITSATAGSLTWQSTIGALVTCRNVGGSAVVPRGTLARGIDLAAVGAPPQVGDLLATFDDGPTPGPADDRWVAHTITGIHSATGGCVGGPLADPVADAARPAWVFDLAPPLAAADTAVAARLLRPQRLALYASGAEWMLGFTEVNPPVGWATIQPAAGPLAPPGASAGLALTWVDSLFAPNATAPAALRVVVRAPLRQPARAAPGRAAAPLDSSGAVIALRNR